MISRPILVAVSSVCSSVVPSGVRTDTSNWDSSFLGKKSLPTAMKSGTIDTNATTDAVTITHRCAMDQRSKRS